MATVLIFLQTYISSFLSLGLLGFNTFPSSEAIISRPNATEKKVTVTPATAILYKDTFLQEIVACKKEPIYGDMFFSADKVIKQLTLGEAGYQIKTVIVDAGHGGHDPGCHGLDTQEKHIALAIAKKLAAGIESQYPNIRVILTRDKDVFVPLYERAGIANRNNADLFISIHCNFLPGSSATQGTETYVMGLHTAEYNLQVAKRENSAILLEEDYKRNYDYDPNSPEGHIMISMVQNAYLQQSILFGEFVEDHLRGSANRRSRGVKQAGFVVLKATAMPSVLIETGFLSNSTEEQFLSAGNGQDKIAESILLAFGKYKNQVESSNYKPDALVYNASELADSSPAATNGYGKPLTYSSIPENDPRPELKTVRETPAVTRSNAPTGGSTYSPPPTSNAAYGPVPNSRPLTPPVENRPPPTYGSVATRPATTNSNAAMIFYVQVSATPNAPNSNEAKWKKLPYAINFVKEDNLFKGRTVAFSVYIEANQAKDRLKELGFSDAFLIVMHNGQRIPLSEAKKILGIP